jgi:hypothetical protein
MLKVEGSRPLLCFAPAPWSRRPGGDRYAVQQVGGQTILEYWIPAGELPEFNANIVGRIEVIAEFP